jgi:hypothetical protein
LIWRGQTLPTFEFEKLGNCILEKKLLVIIFPTESCPNGGKRRGKTNKQLVKNLSSG